MHIVFYCPGDKATPADTLYLKRCITRIELQHDLIVSQHRSMHEQRVLLFSATEESAEEDAVSTLYGYYRSKNTTQKINAVHKRVSSFFDLTRSSMDPHLTETLRLYYRNKGSNLHLTDLEIYTKLIELVGDQCAHAITPFILDQPIFNKRVPLDVYADDSNQFFENLL